VKENANRQRKQPASVKPRLGNRRPELAQLEGVGKGKKMEGTNPTRWTRKARVGKKKNCLRGLPLEKKRRGTRNSTCIAARYPETLPERKEERGERKQQFKKKRGEKSLSYELLDGLKDYWKKEDKREGTRSQMKSSTTGCQKKSGVLWL